MSPSGCLSPLVQHPACTFNESRGRGVAHGLQIRVCLRIQRHGGSSCWALSLAHLVEEVVIELGGMGCTMKLFRNERTYAIASLRLPGRGVKSSSVCDDGWLELYDLRQVGFCLRVRTPWLAAGTR